jgi:hypothetical protein
MIRDPERFFALDRLFIALWFWHVAVASTPCCTLPLPPNSGLTGPGMLYLFSF